MFLSKKTINSILLATLALSSFALSAAPYIPDHCINSTNLICSNDKCICLDSVDTEGCVGNLCVIYKIEVPGCTKKVSVDKALYKSYKAFMASLLDENGEPVPQLSPAQQTMFMFYSTLIENAAKTNCENN